MKKQINKRHSKCLLTSPIRQQSKHFMNDIKLNKLINTKHSDKRNVCVSALRIFHSNIHNKMKKIVNYDTFIKQEK